MSVSRIVLCVTSVLLAGCDMGATLSDGEALALIRANNDYPRTSRASLNVREDSPIGAEVARLIREGYLVEGNRPLQVYFEPTDRGRDLSDGARWNGIYRTWDFYPNTHRWDVSEIVDRRVDSENNTVAIIYRVDREELPYFTTLRELDPVRVDRDMANALSGPSSLQETAVFERWETGWRQR